MKKQILLGTILALMVLVGTGASLNTTSAVVITSSPNQAPVRNTYNDGSFGVQPIKVTSPLPRSSNNKTNGLVKIGLSLLGILLIILMIPFIVYFVIKRRTPPVTQSPKAIKYQNLTPDQIKYIEGWSLGAFFGSFIWALGNKLWLYAALDFIPVLNLYSWIKLIGWGRRLSWEEGDWTSFEQFKQRQKLMAWIIAGILILYIAVSFSR